MAPIHKRILVDEAQRPIAVQVDYDDWLEIERQLHITPETLAETDLSQFSGVIALSEDPLEYQRKMREEWQ
ncbi:MAG: hypothetical protein IT426_07370 [Pirellulales bacterium]|nr:hypothetical protein [Pirellulales bacterium]